MQHSIIHKGNDLILVDIGTGHNYQPSDGALAQNLQAAGVDSADVTKVVLTHGHPDHLWATLPENGGLRYPNATYYVGASEWNFWMDPDYLATMPAVLHKFVRTAQGDLGAIKEHVVLLIARLSLDVSRRRIGRAQGQWAPLCERFPTGNSAQEKANTFHTG